MSADDPKEAVRPENAPAPPAQAPAAAAAAAPDLQAMEQRLAELRQVLAQKEEEARANYDRFLRERAELENFKKRAQRERADALRFASEPLIRDLLPVIDNLERALEHGNGESVLAGVQLVLKALNDVLGRHGVQRIEATGQPFDPSRHEAMAQAPSAEHPPNHVVQQHHSGYLLHDRLLRPALVTVSARKNDSAVETEQKSG